MCCVVIYIDSCCIVCCLLFLYMVRYTDGPFLGAILPNSFYETVHFGFQSWTSSFRYVCWYPIHAWCVIILRGLNSCPNLFRCWWFCFFLSLNWSILYFCISVSCPGDRLKFWKYFPSICVPYFFPVLLFFLFLQKSICGLNPFSIF